MTDFEQRDPSDDEQAWQEMITLEQEYLEWSADRAAQAEYSSWLTTLEQGHDHAKH